MKKLTAKIIILVIAGIILVSGCEEEKQTSTKKGRLIAAENLQLKKDLALCKKELEKQKNLLAKCLKEKKTPEELRQLQKSGEDRARNLLDAVMEENSKQRQTIETLKAEIAELKKELEMR